MATIAAGRSIFRSSSVRNAATKFASSAKSSTKRPSSTANLISSPRIFRCPVELSACIDKMQPYHTATASAVMISMLSVTRFSNAWVTDDF